MMLLPRASLLALPALLSALVVAFPSPTSDFQDTLTPPSIPQQPRWRSISAHLIGRIWGDNNNDANGPEHASRAGRAPPPHTLARYGGDVVLRVNISTESEAHSFAEAADTLLLDVWEYAENWVDVRLSKDIVPSLLGLLPASLQKSHAPLLQGRDLAQAIYHTYPGVRSGSSGTTTQDRTFGPVPRQHGPMTINGAEENIFFADYQPLSVIDPWLRLLASLFTTHVRLVNVGLSYEGRHIRGLRVGVHPTNNDQPLPPRKTVLITGGLHAREWISTSTVTFLAYSLIVGYGKQPSITHLLESFDFVFIPTLNPDGYAYTWETDRLWRKNRQQTSVRFCRGIDLDRGFGFEWEGEANAGNPCSESFAGTSPFAAVEAAALAKWARNETEENGVEFVAFLDLHSYSQQILYPYSYSCTAAPPGQENLEELALGLEKAIRLSSGVPYDVLPACQGNVAAAASGASAAGTLLPLIEPAGGSALDFFAHDLHVKYAYQLKLRDRGSYGFLLPREHIVPTGREILGAMLYLGRFLMEGYGMDGKAGTDVVKLVGVKDEQGSERSGEEGVEEEEEVKKEVRVEYEEDEGWDWESVEDELEPAGNEEGKLTPQWELRRRRRR